jgi:hypothetical protein
MKFRFGIQFQILLLPVHTKSLRTLLFNKISSFINDMNSITISHTTKPRNQHEEKTVDIEELRWGFRVVVDFFPKEEQRMIDQNLTASEVVTATACQKIETAGRLNENELQIACDLDELRLICDQQMELIVSLQKEIESLKKNAEKPSPSSVIEDAFPDKRSKSWSSAPRRKESKNKTPIVKVPYSKSYSRLQPNVTNQ